VNVAVVVPWRNTDPHRVRAYEHVTGHLQTLLPDAIHLPAVDDRSHETFSRAASRNLGVFFAEQAGADVVVLCDADTIPERAPLLAAIEQARKDGRLHMPFDRFRGLTQHGTDDYIAGRPAAGCEAELDWRGSVGGVFVIRPDAWWTAGGMDERFQAWGGEDLAFHRAANTLLGPTQTHAGTIIHLWHPPSQRDGTPENDAVWALAERYAASEGDPDAMRALIGPATRYERQAHVGQ
jgi:hypothetical protein